MKTIFPKIIGDLRTLGTPREWRQEFIGVGLLVTITILALIFL